MKARPSLSLLIISAFICPVAALAQWQPGGAPISTTVQNQLAVSVATDGAGGTILSWEDSRNGLYYNIYSQRIDASGKTLWSTNGIPLSTAAGSQYNPMSVSDGAGGAIVTWYDFRSGTPDIFAQRVDGSGTTLWTVNGVPICTATDYQNTPMIVSDGAGGAIIAWNDSRNGPIDVYAQRVNASGVVQWTTDGVPLCTLAYDQSNVVLVSDGAGGAIAAWNDYRNGVDSDIYAQRIDAVGTVQWTTDGVPVCATTFSQLFPAIASDGAGGAIVAWQDYRSNSTYDIFAQRIDAAGAAKWTINGVPVCGAAGQQYQPSIVSDGAGGAIVAWQDVRGTSADVYAQRMDPSGAPQWLADGLPLCTAANFQSPPSLASDGEGGAVATWEDYRNGTNYVIYAQRISGAGAVQWAADGVNLRNAPGDGHAPVIMEDGAGGSVVAWSDLRSNYDDVYAQRVDNHYGYWGHPEPIVTSVADVPNDQGGHVAVNWDASGRDLSVPATIDFYSVWRAVDMSAAAGRSQVLTSLTSPDDVTLQTPPGVLTQVASSSYYWELVATQSAYRLPAYSFSASTRADSVAGNDGTEAFMVMAHDQTDSHIAFASNTMTGHSVDNLAPAAPLYLTAQRNGAEVDLKWNGVHVSDLKDYAVYRSDASGVTPIQADFLANDADTVLVDSGAPLTSLYYIVTANDVHGNQSKPSNEASVSAATHVGNTPSITALTVLQNRPNPFGAQTELEIGLPAASEIHLEVYDVAGHRVREEDVAGARGWQEIRFAGLDDRGEPLASGMYFYKISAHGETVTRKMVIAR